MKQISELEKQELLNTFMLEHQVLKSRVKALEQQLSRSEAEQIEIAQLKKKKLWMKDRMQILNQN